MMLIYGFYINLHYFIKSNPFSYIEVEPVFDEFYLDSMRISFIILIYLLVLLFFILVKHIKRGKIIDNLEKAMIGLFNNEKMGENIGKTLRKIFHVNWKVVNEKMEKTEEIKFREIKTFINGKRAHYYVLLFLFIISSYFILIYLLREISGNPLFFGLDLGRPRFTNTDDFVVAVLTLMFPFISNFFSYLFILSVNILLFIVYVNIRANLVADISMCFYATYKKLVKKQGEGEDEL